VYQLIIINEKMMIIVQYIGVNKSSKTDAEIINIRLIKLSHGSRNLQGATPLTERYELA